MNGTGERILMRFNSTRTMGEITFDELLLLRCGGFDPDLDSNTVGDIAKYIIEEYNGDFNVYMQSHRGKVMAYNSRNLKQWDKHFLESHLKIAENWDYSKMDPIHIYRNEKEMGIKGGKHRAIILSVLVLMNRIEFQPVPVALSSSCQW